MDRPHVRRRARMTAIALVAAASTVSAACGVTNSDSNAAGNHSTVRVVLQVEPPTLEPCDSTFTATGVVVRSNITEPLIERDADTGKLMPLLATSWTQTDPLTWTFDLRSGVKFQNGAALTAKDAAFSINRALNAKVGCNVKGEMFGDEQLKAVATSDSTLTLTTPEADPVLPFKISFIEIVPSTTAPDSKVREPIGTGPYKIQSWNAGTKLTLAAFDGYWGKQPAYKTAEFQWRNEGTVRAAMVKNGEADIATRLGPDDGIGSLGKTYANNETTGLILTGSLPPLTDIRVRQAINYALDKQGMIDSLYKGTGTEVATQIIRKGIVGFNPDIRPWPYDPAKAKQLIAAAKADGVPVDKPIAIVGRIAEWPNVDQMAQAIQGELAAVGLNVKVKMLETSQQVPYQVRPFVLDQGPYVDLISHGNQAGDAKFSDQYMLQNGLESTIGDDQLDNLLATAEAAQGDARQDGFEKAFAYEHEHVVQFAPIAYMVGQVGIGPSVHYTPDPATGDEMHLAAMTPASGS
jgi:peptide/nickel transport system substrate-binding protein